MNQADWIDRQRCREDAILQRVDWIDLQRRRHAVRWIVAYCLALRQHRAVRVTIN